MVVVRTMKAGCSSLGAEIKVILAHPVWHIVLYRESLMKYTGRCQNDFDAQGRSRQTGSVVMRYSTARPHCRR